MQTKQEKNEIINELKTRIDSSNLLIVWDFKELPIVAFEKIRNELKEVNANTKVYKNTLAKIALKDKGFENLSNILVDQNAFAWDESIDTFNSAKIIDKYSKEYPTISFRGGIFEGKIIDSNKLLQIAQLPSFDEQMSQLASMLQSPIRTLAYLLTQIENFNDNKTLENNKIDKEETIKTKSNSEENNIENIEKDNKIVEENKETKNEFKNK